MDLEKSTKYLIQSCLHYNAARMHSKLEINQYLDRKRASDTDKAQVIEYLETNHIIDDAEFSLLWTESRLRHGKGDRLIQAELRQKGVDQSTIKTTFSSISLDQWREAAAKAAEKQAKKWQGLSGYQQKSALYQVLYQRGFSSNHIDDFMKSRVE
jgi:regulatory protein